MPHPVQPDTGRWQRLAQVDPRRTFALMGAGAVVGLLLAGYALFTARGTSTLVVPADAVALVNQQPVSRIDYLQQLQTLYGAAATGATTAQRRQVLHAMIREELFVQRGKELDLASTDPDVRNALVNAVEAEIAENAVTAQPDETQLRTFFQTHPERYASEGVMTVRDYVFPTGQEEALDAAITALDGRAPTGLLAAFHGKDDGKTGADEFYFAAKIHLGAALFEAARRLATGGLSPPLALGDGVHVLWMEKNRRPVPLDFDTARDRVLNDYRNAAIARSRASDELFLAKRANILTADDFH